MNRYRGENSGKFPTISHAMKEVGGSYYTVRKIMQELEYNYKLSSSNVGKEVSSQTELRNSYLSSGSKSNADEYKPSPEICIPMKPDYVRTEEPCQIVSDIDTSKTRGEVPLPFAEVSSAKKMDDVKEEICYKSVLDVNRLERKNEELRSSPVYSIPMDPKVTLEEEPCETFSNIDTLMIKGEAPQPLPDVSCAKIYEDDNKDILCEPVLDFSSSECKGEEHQSSPEYSNSTKPEVSTEEETCQTVSDIDTSKTNEEVPLSWPDVPSAKKSEVAKGVTHCESVLDVASSESKNEEPQPSHEYSIPKILENTKEKKPYKAVVNMDGSQSIAEEHKKSTGLVVYLFIYSSNFFSSCFTL